jgi:hypothetical protein
LILKPDLEVPIGVGSIGKLDLLRVACDKGGRDGCYGLSRLIERRGRDQGDAGDEEDIGRAVLRKAQSEHRLITSVAQEFLVRTLGVWMRLFGRLNIAGQRRPDCPAPLSPTGLPRLACGVSWQLQIPSPSVELKLGRVFQRVLGRPAEHSMVGIPLVFGSGSG